ncbi:transposable element Tcb2 transposase [Trichonephila clavipes]|nr:transposable element Tcb2 transposase [Trichonephila clavipes]
MVWGAIAYDSRSTLIMMRGTLTGQRYVDDILRLHVGPFLNGLPEAIFQQDNARPHIERVAQDFLRHFQTLPWPARSPNLSPVERAWNQLKRQMPSCHSVHDLELAVQDLWAHLPQDNIRCLINTIPDRVAACIAAGDLKLKNYFAAVVDCNEVISLEPNNVKALFRRGIAHKEAEIFDLAAIDFEILLKLEPENKSAQDQIKQIENMKLQKMKAKKKVVIEEIESESSYDVVENNNIPDLHNKEFSKRLTIEETTEDFRPLLDEICHCERNDDGIQPLSAKTKKMLNIFGDHSAVVRNSKNGLVSTVETNKQTKSSQRNGKRNTSLVLGEFSEETEFKKDFKEIKIQVNSTEKPEIKNIPFGRSQNECSENPILKTEVKTHLEPNPEYENKSADEKISKDLHKSINKILSLTEQNESETLPNINEIQLKKVSVSGSL